MTIHNHKNQAAVNAIPDLSGGSTGQVLAKSSGGGLEFITVSSGGGGDAVKKTITQSTHGFSAGNVLYFAGSAYALAKADDPVTTEVAGIIESVTDTDNFVLTNSGYVAITGMTWTAGTVYRLSEVTAGALTDTEAPAGAVFKPLLTALSATTGWFNQTLGLIMSSSVELRNPEAIFDAFSAGTIEMLDLITETTATNTATALTENHINGAKTSSLHKGYYHGGVSGTTGGTGLTNKIDALRFADYARQNIGVAIGTSQGRQAGIWNATYGFTVGGSDGSFNPGNRDIERITFSTEAATHYSQTLIAGYARHASPAMNAVNFDRGYVGGTVGLTNTVYYVTYSTVAHAVSGASVSEALWLPGGMTDGAKGYLGGGFTGTSSTHRNRIDELNYTTVALSTLSAVLSQARGWIAGAAGFGKGYWCKGWTGELGAPVAGKRCESFDFTAQTITNLGDTLFSEALVGQNGCWHTHGIF